MESSMRPSLLLVTALAASLAGCGLMPSMKSMKTTQTGPAKVADGVLVGPNERSLYTLDTDPSGGGRSACNGPCAANWPPLKATPEARGGGDWTVIARDDGSRQWAYKGRPVYYWSKDTKAGDRSGDGVNGVWRLARP
jgi:predicted lipoprotein with Yx(FWY)xxD motif